MIDHAALDEAVGLELDLLNWGRSRRLYGEAVQPHEIGRYEYPRIIRNYHRIVAQRIQTGSQ